MSRIYTSVDQLIGGTPLLELRNIEKEFALKARLLAKLEYLNPAGSVKDRVGKSMLDDAEERGILKSGSVIIEPTSGNTGIGLAAVAAARGYRLIITMPETMSVERRMLLKAYGAELVLTDGSKGMSGAIARAEELSREIEGSFVAGAGTGGTLTGVGEYLKSKKAVKIIAVEPASSAVLSGRPAGSHGLQGIGAGFVPEVLNTKILDEIFPVTEEEAYAAGRLIGLREGVLVGISSGAALHAAIETAKRPENEDKTIVVLLPDTGDRFLSTPLFAA